MILLTWIFILVLILILAIIFILCLLDYRNKRVLNVKSNISIIIPCYNDGDSVEQTIKSIYESYDRNKIEIIVVNDKSKDNSLQVLEKLQNVYNFKLIDNERNFGKAESINKAYKFVTNKILFVIDSDIIVTPLAIYDVLARLESEENIAAVSCPYMPSNKGFFPLMQEIEYNVLYFLQASYNKYSAVSIWGGFFAVKTIPFEKVGMLSTNMLVEDMDLALKLNSAGYKVQQSFIKIETSVPDTFIWWFKQKMRWTSGGAQCLIKHFKVWLKHPIHIIFTFLFLVLSLFFVINLLNEIIFINNVWDSYTFLRDTTTLILSLKLIGITYGLQMVRDIFSRLSFTLFSLPYVIQLVKKPVQIFRILWVFPFSLIYTPLFSLVSLIGLFRGVFIYFKFRDKSSRAW